MSFGAGWLSIVWMGHSLFVLSLSEGHASCLVNIFFFEGEALMLDLIVYFKEKTLCGGSPGFESYEPEFSRVHTGVNRKYF